MLWYFNSDPHTHYVISDCGFLDQLTPYLPCQDSERYGINIAISLQNGLE